MGHERIGYLPKSRKWREIVNEIASFSGEEETIVQIANHSTKNVINRYKEIQNDSGVFAAFEFIVLFSHSAGLKNSAEFLKEHGIKLPTNFNLLKLSTEISEGNII